MISSQALQELKEVFLKEKGYSPKDEELVEFGAKLLTLFDVVYRPIKKTWLDEQRKLPRGNKNTGEHGVQSGCPGAINNPLQWASNGQFMDKSHKKR